MVNPIIRCFTIFRQHVVQHHHATHTYPVHRHIRRSAFIKTAVAVPTIVCVVIGGSLAGSGIGGSWYSGQPSYGGQGGTYGYGSGIVGISDATQPVAVPEPNSFFILAFALLLFGVIRWKAR